MSSMLDKPAVRHAALPISVDQYHQLGEAGIIAEATELLRGVIVEKMIKSPEHSWTVQFLVNWLTGSLEPGFFVRQEQPLTLGDSEPEPDVAVVAGTSDDYRESHPTAALAILEVAIATAELDRAKADLYAAAGVPEYWIVLPMERSVEVYLGPTSSGYQDQTRHGDQDVISLATMPHLSLELARLFPDRS